MRRYLVKKKLAAEILALAQNIKLLGLDIDGVLTDTRIFLTDIYKEELKGFNTKDGQGIKFLQNSGIKVALITARKHTDLVTRRAAEMGIDLCFQGVTDKLKIMQNLMKELKLDWQHIAYMGDDLPDLPILTRAALSASPKDGISYVKSECHYVCKKKGGFGAVREFADLILVGQNKFETIIKAYE